MFGKINTLILTLGIAIFLLSCNNETKKVEEPKASSDQVSKASTNKADETTTSTFEKEITAWKGTINKTIKVHGTFEVINNKEGQANDVLKGEIIYDKIGKPIQLIGQLKDGYINLIELDENANVTGILSGEYANGEIPKAYWFSPTTRDEFEWEVETTPTTIQKEKDTPIDIEGVYSYQYGEEGASGTLEVTAIEGDKIKFNISTVTGAPAHHMATVQETEGQLEGNTVVYDMTDYEILEEGENKCIFKLRFFENMVVVDYVENSYNCMDFGHNAGVSGLYYKTK